MSEHAERDRLDRLLARLADGTVTPDDIASLEAILAADPAARRRYVRYLDLHQTLTERFDTSSQAESPRPPELRGWRRPARLFVAASVLLIAWVVIRTPNREPTPVAKFGPLIDCRWVGAAVQFQPGESIHAGDRIELASGEATIIFDSGAVVSLVGPAIFDPTSSNGCLLAVGQLRAVAATPQSKGFTVRTRTARVIDIGTEFVTTVSPDGRSRVDVTRGEVDVRPDGTDSLHRLRTGQSLTVEPGAPQVIVRIESGDETPAFRFPTIEPPSDVDFADRSRGHATIRKLAGTPSPQSGPLAVLLDGRGQSKPDAPLESVFFHDDDPGLLLVDLGRSVPVRKVNVYSWHVHGGLGWDRVRASQRYDLYGASGDTPPATDDLHAGGWVSVARVNTDEFFNADAFARPAQQATSVTATRGMVGPFRYLLWDVRPTWDRKLKAAAHTFYGEIDVYTAP